MGAWVQQYGSQGRFSAIVVADPDRFGDIVDENLAVADFSSAGGGHQRANHFIGARVGNHHFDLDFRQQVDLVLHAAVDLFVALLPAMTADFAHGHTVDP